MGTRQTNKNAYDMDKNKVDTKKLFKYLVMTSMMFFFAISVANAARIKDISEIVGVRQNQLVGYGLVVGLDGSGDDKKNEFMIQSMARMLEKMGMAVDPKDIEVENVATVMVTAELPPFAKSGTKIDAVVSSIGSAKTIYGGVLLMTPLKAADGKVYAVAQGPIILGGFSVGGANSSVSKNFPTVGRVVGGVLIEREIKSDFGRKSAITLALHNPDFTTSSRVADIINTFLYEKAARTIDAGNIELKIPEKYSENVVGFVSLIEGLSITPDETAKVVINERTGTIIVGSNVKISTIAIAHGNLSIEVRESTDVSQPLPFSSGETVAVPKTDLTVTEEKKKLLLLKTGVSISDVVRALNALGVSPRDLITIFQSIRAAGALQADLEVM